MSRGERRRDAIGTRIKRNPRRVSLLICLLALLGVGMILYPTVSNWWYERQFQQEISAYDQFADVDCDGLWEQAQAYNRELAQRGTQLSASDEEAARVSALLDPLGNGMMGYVDIPKIDVHLPIYQGTEESALQAGAGWWIGTSLPTGGENTHCVLTAHTGLVKAKMFTDLDQMELGDTFSLSILDRVLTYQVDQILVTEPTDFEPLLIQEGGDYVTLYTCTPYGVNTHRLLVRGSRVETPEPDPPAAPPHEQGHILAQLAAALLLLVFGLLLLCWTVRHRPRGKREAQTNQIFWNRRNKL